MAGGQHVCKERTTQHNYFIQAKNVIVYQTNDYMQGQAGVTRTSVDIELPAHDRQSTFPAMETIRILAVVETQGVVRFFSRLQKIFM